MIRRAFPSIDSPPPLPSIFYRLANKNPIKIRIMSVEQASAIKSRYTSPVLRRGGVGGGGEGERIILRARYHVARNSLAPLIADGRVTGPTRFRLTLAN
jgi:hypothetical protein